MKLYETVGETLMLQKYHLLKKWEQNKKQNTLHLGSDDVHDLLIAIRFNEYHLRKVELMMGLLKENKLSVSFMPEEISKEMEDIEQRMFSKLRASAQYELERAHEIEEEFDNEDTPQKVLQQERNDLKASCDRDRFLIIEDHTKMQFEIIKRWIEKW